MMLLSRNIENVMRSHFNAKFLQHSNGSRFSPQNPWLIWSQVLGHLCSVRYEFRLMERVLNPIKKLLVALITLMPLLYQCILQGRPSVVGCMVCSWVIFMSTFLLQQCAKHFSPSHMLESVGTKFQLGISSLSPCSVTHVSCVFSNRSLTSGYGE